MDFSALQRTSKITDEWRYPEAAARASGLLQVDRKPDHRLYWEEYGNPAGEPVMVLHGGPGGASSPAMARYFDPARYRIVLFDQRGCGKSIPTVAADGPEVALANNSTAHLIADIERLRDALGITGRMHVFGGSWGSTLAMAYAIAHPDHCASLILGGIFLGAPEDLRFMYQGNAASFAEAPYALTEPGSYVSYPGAWARFLAPSAPADRGDIGRVGLCRRIDPALGQRSRHRAGRAHIGWRQIAPADQHRRPGKKRERGDSAHDQLSCGTGPSPADGASPSATSVDCGCSSSRP